MNTNNNTTIENNGFNLFYYTESNKQFVKFIYPSGRILILKKDVIKILGINRKTLNTIIARGKPFMFTIILNGERYFDINEILLYLKRYREREKMTSS